MVDGDLDLSGEREDEDEGAGLGQGQGQGEFSYSRDLSLAQAWNFRLDRQAAIGFITSLSMGTAVLAPKLGMVDPTLLGTGTASATSARAAKASIPAVGPLVWIGWDLGDTDPISFKVQVSAQAKQQLMMVQYAQFPVVDVTVSWVTYEYDPEAHKYYVAFASSTGGAGGGAVKGQLSKQGRKLDLTVAAAPSLDQELAPPNFSVEFSIVPKDNLTQTLYLATGDLLRVQKSWGRSKAA